MRIPLVLSLFFCLMLGLVVSCSKDKKRDYLAEADCSQVDPLANTYAFSVKNILDATCAGSGCHDAATQSEGINLSTYASAKTAFETKEVLCAINHGEGCEPMPKGGSKLPTATINMLACWAKNGYPQ